MLLLLIVLLSAAFWAPNPPYIEDAVTRSAASGFGIHIPPGRIVFEPFLGPLLFFLRADQALLVYLFLAFWSMVAFLAGRMLHEKRTRSRWSDAIRTGFAQGVLWLPVILILFVATMLFILFSPLPSNTITHNDPDVVLVNFHSHTYNSHDGVISPWRLIDWHERNGFDAFFLTEHNHHTITLELAQQQIDSLLPPAPLLLVGQEYSGSNHLLLLGLIRPFNSKDYSDQAAIDTAHAHGGAAVLAHWFAPGKRTRPLMHYVTAGVDGFEIANQAEGIYYPGRYMQQLHTVAREQSLLLIGSVDYHGYGPACFAWNALHIPGWRTRSRSDQSEAIMDLLRSRDQSRLQVLLYRDRERIASGLEWLSPFITVLDYFRSLNLWQMLSWLLWFVVLRLSLYFAPRIPDQLRLRYQTRDILAIAGAGAATITLLFGLWMLAQTPLLLDENRVFMEYGAWLTALGTILFFYCINLLRKLKKMQLF